MKKPNNVLILLYLFLAAMAVEVVILARQNMILKGQLQMASGGQQQTESATPGMTVPSLQAKTVDDRDISIDYTNPGQKTLLYFHSHSCPQCLRNIPQWRKLTDMLEEEKNVRIWGIVKGSLTEAEAYADGYTLNFPIGVCPLNDTVITEGYKVNFVPTTMLIDGEGHVLAVFVGVLSNDDLTDISNRIFTNTKL